MNVQIYNIAQINIARLRYPIDNPEVKDFVSNLDRINEIAEKSEGFIWRLKDDTGNATVINISDDPLMIINMSVWQTIDQLFKYTYSSDHIDVFRRRGEWFEKHGPPHLALWWIPENTIPTPEEGKERLQHLEEYGPTPYSFTFKKRFSYTDLRNYSKGN